MKKFVTILFLCLAAVSIGGATGHAGAPKELTWENLIPTGDEIEIPYQNLSVDQQVEIEMLATIRAKTAAGVINEVHPLFEDGREIEFKLRKDGIDVDGMIARVQEMQAKVAERNRSLVHELDGETVRLPGYVLPLEFEGAAVKEFLLVPFVGACIHVPPPPINQTVVVKLSQSYAATELYEPVWVTGRMAVKETSRELSLVDGSANIDAGYTIQGSQVEPYKQN